MFDATNIDGSGELPVDQLENSTDFDSLIVSAIKYKKTVGKQYARVDGKAVGIL